MPFCSVSHSYAFLGKSGGQGSVQMIIDDEG